LPWLFLLLFKAHEWLKFDKQFLGYSQANNISLYARSIAPCLCLSGLALLKLKTETSKGLLRPLEAKHWQLPINPFHGGLQKVEG
jgi:hypothetical protein